MDTKMLTSTLTSTRVNIAGANIGTFVLLGDNPKARISILNSLYFPQFISKSQLNLEWKQTNFVSPAASTCRQSARGSNLNMSKYVTPTEPDRWERKVMTGVIKVWTKQASLESRV